MGWITVAVGNGIFIMSVNLFSPSVSLTTAGVVVERSHT